MVKQYTTGSNGVEEILDLGYYRNRKTGGDGGKWDALCATILSYTLFQFTGLLAVPPTLEVCSCSGPLHMLFLSHLCMASSLTILSSLL